MGHKNSKEEKKPSARGPPAADQPVRASAPATPAAVPTGTRPHLEEPIRGPSTVGVKHHLGDPTQRTRGPCRYFLAGNCRYGASCRYQHPSNDGQSSGGSPTAPSPHTPQRSPHRHTIRSEEQALLAATLHSLKDSLAAATTSQERSAIYEDMKKAAIQYKQEQQRIRDERARHRSASFSTPSNSNPPERPSPLRNVQFPTFSYDSARYGQQREDGSEDRHECSICLCSYDEGQEILVLPCLHWFHATCVRQWMEKHTDCPLCQLDILSALTDQS